MYIIISKLQAVKHFESVTFDHMAVYSTLSIVTELWVGQPGNHGLTSISSKRFFSLLQSIHTGSGFHPAYPVSNGSCFPMGTMWSKHEVDLSPSSSAEIRNTWLCTSISSCGFVMLCLIKHDITSIYLPVPIYTQTQDTYTLVTLLFLGFKLAWSKYNVNSTRFMTHSVYKFCLTSI